MRPAKRMWTTWNGFRTLTLLLVLSPFRASSHSSPARAFWTDVDTPLAERTITASDGKEFILIASDEFNLDGRNFSSGADKLWTAIDAPDVTNGAVEYNSPTHVTTQGGYLEMKLSQTQMGGRSYVGASIQSWNKFCFTGGIVVTRNKWPSVPATWPGAWMMGNLGRPQYEASNQGVWPFSYDRCDDNSTSFGQKISRCDPNPGHGLRPFQGRGAPEIDILEAWATSTTFFFPSSLQIAPALPVYFRPGDGGYPSVPYGGSQARSWYADVEYGQSINPWYGHDEKGYWTNAIASKTTLTEKQRNDFNLYKVEWTVGRSGFIKFFFNDELILHVPAKALKGRCDPSGNCVGERMIPNEPMAFVLTIALAPNWAGGSGGLTSLPGHFLVDYIRWYQDPSMINIGCNPPDFPTAEYIQENQHLYGPPALPAPPAEAAFHYMYSEATSSADNGDFPSKAVAEEKPEPTPTGVSTKTDIAPNHTADAVKPDDKSPTSSNANDTFDPITSAPSTSGENASSNSSTSVAATAGIVTGVCVGAVGVVGVLIFFMRRRWSTRNPMDERDRAGDLAVPLREAAY